MKTKAERRASEQKGERERERERGREREREREQRFPICFSLFYLFPTTRNKVPPSLFT
jgi:hypothetical protein